MGVGKRISVNISNEDVDWLKEQANAGMSYREMAECLDRPMGTVKTILFRLRREGFVERRYIDWTTKESDSD